MSITSTQSPYVPQQVPAERRPYGDANTAPSTLNRQDMGAGHSLATQPAQRTHAGRTVTVQSERVSHSAQVEEYKRKIATILCRAFDKSSKKAADIVKYLPTERLEVHFPARVANEGEAFGNGRPDMHLPAESFIYQPEDILERIHDGLLWIDNNSSYREQFNKILHFEGCQPADTKEDRLRLRALMLLTCAWIDTNEFSEASTGNYFLTLLAEQRVREAYNVLAHKYATDPYEQGQYKAAKKQFEAQLDKKMASADGMVDYAAMLKFVNKRAEAEGTPLFEDYQLDSNLIAAKFVLPELKKLLS